jgi:hypothetical protein
LCSTTTSPAQLPDAPSALMPLSVGWLVSASDDRYYLCFYSENTRQNRVRDFAHSRDGKTAKQWRLDAKNTRKPPFLPCRIAIAIFSHRDNYAIAVRSLWYRNAIGI